MLMPQIFAEMYLTIFTKHPQCVDLSLGPVTEFILHRYLGPVQAGYRAVLKSIPELPTAKIEPPSTPTRGHSRTASLTSIQENPFTTVPWDYTPKTPSRSRQSLKRARDGGSLGSIEDDERQPKRQA